MDKFKCFLKKIFVLSPMYTAIFAFFGFSFVLAVAIFHIKIPALQYASYVSSAYALIITVTGFPYIIALTENIMRRIKDHELIKKLQNTKYGNLFFNDIHFRTKIFLYQGFFMNILYIAIKMACGIYYRSSWFVSLAFYYLLLAIMRLILLRNGKGKKTSPNLQTEMRLYRMCGIVLLIMNEALIGIILYMLYENKGFNYPGILIYAMALYAFYAVITAIINLVKFKKYKSPVLSAAKIINLVAAMVSILSLETAMLAQFGGNEPVFRKAMVGATGGCVCAAVIIMAVFMIVKSTKNLKNDVSF